MYHFSRFLVALYCIAQVVVNSELLFFNNIEQALLEDLLPPVSAECAAGGAADGAGTFTYTFDFTSQDDPGHWDPTTFSFEEDVFLAEIKHAEDSGVDKDWVIRIGPGGNIYSFVSRFGEAMPPQLHEDAPWIDEVWQFVGVNDVLNGSNDNTDPWFIHQAGGYTKEAGLREKPFYSPN